MTFENEQKEIDETLHKTDFGSAIFNHRKTIVSVVIAILLLSLSYVIWQAQKREQTIANLDRLYLYEKDYLIGKKFEDQDQANKASSAFLALDDAVLSEESSVAVAIKLVEKLRAQKLYQASLEVLEKTLEQQSKSSKTRYFLAYHLATAYENQQSWDKAIAVLETLLNDPLEVFESRLYLDLGRLYAESGNLEQARSNLLHVVDNFPGDELANMAEILLQEIESDSY